MFDGSNQVFFNHSSLFTDITTSNSNMARVSLLNNRYDVRNIKFLDQTGTVYINAVTNGLYTKSYSDSESLNLPNDIKSQMRIEIVNNVDV
jgi:hypothetical protein